MSDAPLAEENVHRLEAALGHAFRNRDLLALALGPADPDRRDAALTRRRLRFVGDAVWNFSVALAAAKLWPHASAGELTRVRAVWSRSSGLARLAREAGIAGLEGEESDRVLGERLESILGAVLEDGGLAAIQALADRVITRQAGPAAGALDPKSALQMLAQAQAPEGRLPAYRLLERRGPPHRPTFRVGVRSHLPETEIQAEGEGPSRQAAEQDAARRILEGLQASGHNIS
jgi:ribonuclease-3